MKLNDKQLNPTPFNWLTADDRSIPAISHVSTPLELALHQLHQGTVAAHFILRRTGLFQEDIAKQNFKVTPRQFASLLGNIKLENENMASTVGLRYLPGSFHEFSDLLMHSPDINAFLSNIERFGFVYSPLLTPRLCSTSSTTILLFDDRFGVVTHFKLKRFMFELMACAIVSCINWLQPQPLNWTLEVCHPRNIRQPCMFDQWGVNVHYASPQYRLSIQTGDLARQMARASNTVYQLVSQKCAEYEEQAISFSLLDVVRGRLRANLRDMPKLSDMANALEMSDATFKRKLKLHHTHYQRLVDEVRCSETLLLQKEGLLSDEQIAEKLNFYDVSNFRRSLKRWRALP
ncbi:MAG: AraC family transcriptional regulator [Pseudomonadales bacterium]|nr:AraC family transcriptional regulator [Pseudomonadales bacterium]